MPAHLRRRRGLPLALPRACGGDVMTPRVGDRALVAMPAPIVERIDAIVRQVRRGRVGGCSHLEADPVGMTCVQHPSRIRCGACHLQHGKSHTITAEFDCDVCGKHMPTSTELAVNLAHSVEVDVLVPIGRGRTAAVGVIIVSGWGACAEHFRMSGGGR